MTKLFRKDNENFEKFVLSLLGNLKKNVTMSKFYVFFAPGFEEIEAVAPIDILRRAGAEVEIVSISDVRLVAGADGIAVQTDTIISEVKVTDQDWMILPGGMPGATNLVNCPALACALKAHADNGGQIAAICASPAVVLAQLGLLKGVNATCYPGFEDGLMASGANYVETGVVIDGNITTASGPGYATDFGLAIVEHAFGEEVADQVASGMLLK